MARNLSHPFVISSRRNSFAFSDYYRVTRREDFGPYYREPVSLPDMTATLYQVGSESLDSSHIYFLPDIFEDDEMMPEAEPDNANPDAHVEHIGADHAPRCRQKAHKKWGWANCFTRICSILLRK